MLHTRSLPEDTLDNADEAQDQPDQTCYKFYAQSYQTPTESLQKKLTWLQLKAGGGMQRVGAPQHGCDHVFHRDQASDHAGGPENR